MQNPIFTQFGTTHEDNLSIFKFTFFSTILQSSPVQIDCFEYLPETFYVFMTIY